MARWPMRGRRIGEAAVPGPDIRVVSCNVTSWRRWTQLADCAEVLFLQEAHLKLDHVEELSKAAGSRGWKLHLGEAVNHEYLTVALTKKDVVWARNAPVPDRPSAAAGRVQYLVLQWGRGRAIHAIQMYGHPGQRQLQTNSSILEWATAKLSEAGQVPGILVGDFNCRLQCTSIAPALFMAGWTDFFQHAGVTSIPSHGRASRLDYILCNRQASYWMKEGEVLWDRGIATHAALRVHVHVYPGNLAPMKCQHERLDGPAGPGWTEERKQQAVHELKEKYEHEFLEAARVDDVEAMWDTWQAAGTWWLRERQGKAQAGRRPYAPARWQRDMVAAAGRGGEAADADCDQALLRLRRLEQLQQLAGKQREQSAAGISLMKALQLQALPDAIALAQLLAQARCVYEQARAQARSRRRVQWLTWVHEALANGGGRLFRWIRNNNTDCDDMQPLSNPTATPTSTCWRNALVGGPWNVYLFVSTAWRSIWQCPEPACPQRHWEAACSELPDFPAVRPWTPELIDKCLSNLKRNKAPGLDGWRAGDFRAQPRIMVEWLAMFYNAVEAKGRWPERLCKPEGVLLDKPGPNREQHPGLHRRPIWLLPMGYRLWASGRASLFAEWREGWPGATGIRSAEEQAWHLSLTAGAAQRQGRPLGGFAVDWSKAYDRIALNQVEFALCAAGIPAVLALPILQTYQAERRLRINGVLGPEWQPTRGILPGCALACFVLCLVTYPLESKLRHTTEQHGAGQVRLYVDDLTAWYIGEQGAVAAACLQGYQVVQEFAAEYDWVINTAKSTFFGSTPPLRSELRRASHQHGLGVADRCRDLGLVQAVGIARRMAVDKDRINRAVPRYDRISLLPVPFAVKCRLVATSATAAALYGAALGGASSTLMGKVRAAAKRCICAGGTRAAAEVVFSVICPAWRADPLALAILQPLLMLARAIRGQRWLEEWQQALSEGEAIGAMGALQRSFRTMLLKPGARGWTCTSTGTCWEPQARSVADTRHFLLNRWRQLQALTLAGRRKTYDHVMDGIDIFASTKIYKSLTPAATGALRCVQAGYAITEAVAQKWTGSSLCPHCLTAVEDLAHRFWHCQRWDQQRLQASAHMGWLMPTEGTLRERLHPGTLLTGLLPIHGMLQALMREAEKCTGLPWPVVGDGKPIDICTDGACLFGRDPLLRRAGWGFVEVDEHGELLEQQCGRVHGRQCVPRAELQAVFEAVRFFCKPLVIYTDSRFVASGICGIQQGWAVKDWPHEDLWLRLREPALNGLLSAHWIKAHTNEEDFVAKGGSRRIWRGNSRADQLAGQGARSHLPPADLVRYREQQLQDLELAQRVITNVQLANLIADHQPRDGQGARMPRRWTKVRRGIRRQQAAAAHGLHGQAVTQAATVPPPPPPAYPPGLHQLSLQEGQLSCSACGRTAAKVRWHSLAWTPCDADPQGWQWRRATHQAVENGGRWECQRCGGSIPLRRGHAAFCDRRCPAWVAVASGQSLQEAMASDTDWGQLVARQLNRPVAGGKRNTPRQMQAAAPMHGGQEDVEEQHVTGEDAPPPDEHLPQAEHATARLSTEQPVEASEGRLPARPTGLRWLPHTALLGSGFVACLHCGRVTHSWPKLASRPCSVQAGVLPRRVHEALQAGHCAFAGGCLERFTPLLAARRGAGGPA